MADTGEAIEDIVPWGWPYAPAFMLAGIHWIFDFLEFIPFMFIVTFVVGVFVIIGNLFLLFTGKPFHLKRFLTLVLPGTVESLIPGVNLLPLMIGSVWAIYLQDKAEIAEHQAAALVKGKPRIPGRFTASIKE